MIPSSLRDVSLLRVSYIQGLASMCSEKDEYICHDQKSSGVQEISMTEVEPGPTSILAAHIQYALASTKQQELFKGYIHNAPYLFPFLFYNGCAKPEVSLMGLYGLLKKLSKRFRS
jgi:hypothetical protein